MLTALRQWLQPEGEGTWMVRASVALTGLLVSLILILGFVFDHEPASFDVGPPVAWCATC